MNTVLLQCNRCSHIGKDNDFYYLRDGIFACPICLSKYTHIHEIIKEK